MSEKRDFISIQDLSNAEIESLFCIADKMRRLIRESHGQLAGHILGSLFLEPSTRTRLSFEAAMNRLGGRVLTITDANASSFSKGESLADSVRMVSSYTDIIVLRHPLAGAARVAAEHSDSPVINAGDGGHEHPTQTLCDLYALKRLKGDLAKLKVVLYGDLKYGRTTHSLALALVRFGADVLAIAEKGLELPSYVREDCAALTQGVDRDVVIRGARTIFQGGEGKGLLFSKRPESWGLEGEVLDLRRLELDAIYVTRLQRERAAGGEASNYSLPNVDTAFLSAGAFEKAVVLHPLPRLDEIHPDVDRDPRGAYFQQAAWGVPIRMALLSFLLGKEVFEVAPRPRRTLLPLPTGVSCANVGCILNDASGPKTGSAWCGSEGRLRCAYCDQPLPGQP
ncbi:MAG: aspartate carbamoyltransferase [Planctomycetota bacterium]